MGIGQFFTSEYGYNFVCPLAILPTAIPRRLAGRVRVGWAGQACQSGGTHQRINRCATNFLSLSEKICQPSQVPNGGGLAWLATSHSN
jgi:hypothetical protein